MKTSKAKKLGFFTHHDHGEGGGDGDKSDEFEDESDSDQVRMTTDLKILTVFNEEEIFFVFEIKWCRFSGSFSNVGSESIKI